MSPRTTAQSAPVPRDTLGIHSSAVDSSRREISASLVPVDPEQSAEPGLIDLELTGLYVPARQGIEEIH